MSILTIRVCFADSWAWYLKEIDELEIYRGPELVACLGADTLRHLIAHYLAQAHLTVEVMDATRKPLASAPARTQPLPLGGPEKARQEARRAARRARKGRLRARA